MEQECGLGAKDRAVEMADYNYDVEDFSIVYQFNDTEIITYEPFGKITYELYDEDNNLLEEGNLGNFDDVYFHVNKSVPRNSTIFIKVHFRIFIQDDGNEIIIVRALAQDTIKSAMETFNVEKK